MKTFRKEQLETHEQHRSLSGNMNSSQHGECSTITNVCAKPTCIPSMLHKAFTLGRMSLVLGKTNITSIKSDEGICDAYKFRAYFVDWVQFRETGRLCHVTSPMCVCVCLNDAVDYSKLPGGATCRQMLANGTDFAPRMLPNEGVGWLYTRTKSAGECVAPPPTARAHIAVTILEITNA